MTSFGTRPSTWQHCMNTDCRQEPCPILLLCTLHVSCSTPACDKYIRAFMQEGSKAIFHLEGFVARFMSEYKTWSIMMLGS